MHKSSLFLLVLTLAFMQFGAASRGQYDEAAREAEKQARVEKRREVLSRNPVRGLASGVKNATLDSTRGLIEDTAEGTTEDLPVIGTLEGARRGTEKVLDGTVKGAVKIATLGYGELNEYEVRQPEANSGDPTKITIKLPGT